MKGIMEKSFVYKSECPFLIPKYLGDFSLNQMTEHFITELLILGATLDLFSVPLKTLIVALGLLHNPSS